MYDVYSNSINQEIFLSRHERDTLMSFLTIEYCITQQYMHLYAYESPTIHAFTCIRITNNTCIYMYV